jgi:aspartate-semialdehyde dehydrogenase
MRDKIRVGVLGATGAVGQRFVEALADHPWFKLTALTASDASAGRRYADACRWLLSSDMPSGVADMLVHETSPGIDCDLVFSALPGDLAGAIEEAFAGAGYGVFSNASAHRQDSDVPLLIPEVNPRHLALVAVQRARRGWDRGFIVTNPNCSAVMLTVALAPLHEAFGVRSVLVSTMQGLSGAGYPGVPSLDALDNVIPYIGGEEEKMSFEPRKMLGELNGDQVELAGFSVSAHCNRVPAREGHLETVSVGLDRRVTLDEVLDAWRNWQPLPQQLNLPTAPRPPLVVRGENDRPQTRLDRDAGRGMAVSVGRLRPCEILDIKFVVLGHNTIRGAAGASVLNAELMLAQEMI